MRYPRRIENLIANFRSLPEDESQSIDRHPSQFDSLLEILADRYKIGKLTPEEIIASNWKLIMGEPNANRCKPQKIDRRDRLIILVANATLRQELSFHRNMILEKIRRLKNCNHIMDIILAPG
jgi:hypothetical protein